MLGLTACVNSCSIGQAKLSRHEYTQIIMGVEARIVLYSENEQTASHSARAAFGRMNDLDAVLSDYRYESELMRVCRASGGPPTHVSDDLFRILVQADKVATMSNGAFDPSVGPIVRLWREARRTGERPTQAATTDAMSRVGWSKVSLDAQRRTVQLAVPDAGVSSIGRSTDPCERRLVSDSGPSGQSRDNEQRSLRPVGRPDRPTLAGGSPHR